MSFETTLKELRQLEPFTLEDIIEISNQLERNESTKKHVQKMWLACQLANSVGFSVSIVNELWKNEETTAESDQWNYGVAVRHCEHTYCFRLPKKDTAREVVLAAKQKIFNFTGFTFTTPDLLFDAEPVEDLDTPLDEYDQGRAVLKFELVDRKQDMKDFIFTHVLWDQSQIGVKMTIKDTVQDLLIRAAGILAETRGLKKNLEVITGVYLEGCSFSTPADTQLVDIRNSRGEDYGTYFNPFPLVVRTETRKTSIPRATARYIPKKKGDVYHISMLWAKCQIDFRLGQDATCLQVLRRAKEIIESKTALTVKVEDAWDFLYYKNEIVDFKQPLSELSGVVLNDPHNPIAFYVNVEQEELVSSPHIQKLRSQRQLQFVQNMKERRQSHPEFLCHVFWNKHFANFKVPVTATVEDMLSVAQKELSTKAVSLDLQDGCQRLTFRGNKINRPSALLSNLPGFAEEISHGDGLHFVIPEVGVNYRKSTAKCLYCSLWWKHADKGEEFLVVKMDPGSSCFDLLETFASQWSDFDPEKDGEKYLWLNHDLFIENPRECLIESLPGAMLMPEADTIKPEAGLHFLIDATRERIVPPIPMDARRKQHDDYKNNDEFESLSKLIHGGRLSSREEDDQKEISDHISEDYSNGSYSGQSTNSDHVGVKGIDIPFTLRTNV